eukprot:NODE_864_length_3613_cov_0.374787.p1 type:complete len:386 gc:universal NODE_864_length_3613_cov_0.374787:3341-2184(-)
MSLEFSALGVSQANSASAVSDLRSFKPVSMFSSNDGINLFERAQRSGFNGLAASKTRTMLYSVVGSKVFNNYMLFTVLINTVNMIFQSTKPFADYYSYYLSMFDSICLGVYVMEMVLKLSVFQTAYFKSGWNLFDITIVSLSVVSTLTPIMLGNSNGTGKLKVFTTFKVFKVLKAIRALRVLRTISFLKSLQVVVATLLKSIPALSSIVGLAILVIIIFAVIAKSFYGEVDPDHFGSIGDSLFTLFTCISLDQWTTLWQSNENQAPTIGYFLAFYVLLQNFVILNVFVAVLVSNLESSRKTIKKEIKAEKKLSVESDDSQIEFSSDSSNSSTLKDTSIEEYHPDLSTKYKKLILYQRIYEELTAIDENYYYMDQQNRILNSLITK